MLCLEKHGTPVTFAVFAHTHRHTHRQINILTYTQTQPKTIHVSAIKSACYYYYYYHSRQTADESNKSLV